MQAVTVAIMCGISSHISLNMFIYIEYTVLWTDDKTVSEGKATEKRGNKNPAVNCGKLIVLSWYMCFYCIQGHAIMRFFWRADYGL